jgi:hypothetical protein
MSDDHDHDPARRREAGLSTRMPGARRVLSAELAPDQDRDDAGRRPVGEAQDQPTATRRVYTGVGSRATPPDILDVMADLAVSFVRVGWTLRSGGGAGADQAFERGAVAAGGTVEVFLPWAGFNGRQSPRCRPPAAAFELAASIHPAWPRLTDRARHLHARNVQQVLGAEVRSPSAFVVCWTVDGAECLDELSRETGGTATAIAVAVRWGVPVLNLAKPGRLERVLTYLR